MEPASQQTVALQSALGRIRSRWGSQAVATAAATVEGSLTSSATEDACPSGIPELDRLLAGNLTDPDNARLAKRLRKHRAHLLNFLDHDGLVRSGLRRRPIAEITHSALPRHIPTLADLYAECGTGYDLSLDDTGGRDDCCLRVVAAEGEERVTPGIVEAKLEGQRLAGGIDDAVVAAVGFAAALAQHLDAADVAAGVGGGFRHLDDGAGVPAGEVPGVGGQPYAGKKKGDQGCHERPSHQMHPLTPNPSPPK